MFKAGVVGVVLPMFLLIGDASAQNEKLANALNNVQSEMSECIAYYTNVAVCIKGRDAALSDSTQKTIDALTLTAVKLGRSIGMTQDAMMSRLTMYQGQQRELVQNNCANMSSLFTRHAARCKQVVENGDSILDEYLKR